MINSQLQTLAKTLEQAQQNGTKLVEAQTHAKLGKILLEHNAYREASQHYRQAVSIFTSLGLMKQQAQSLNHLGITKIMTQQPQEAIKDLESALGIAETLKDHTLQLAIYGNLGLAYAALKDYIKAVKFHKKIMDTSIELKDKHMQLQAQINLADVYLQDKRPQQALGFALVAHDLAQELNAEKFLVIIFDLLGTIYSRQKDLRTAIEYHQKAINLSTKIGDPHRQAIALANKALAHEALTETEDAYQAMQEAQSIFQTLNSEYASKTQKNLARIRKTLDEKD